MPTLEELEQRVAELERTLPTLRRERIDTRPVEERLSALRQEVAEQQRRLSALEQSTQQKFETLTGVIFQQSQALSQQFGALNARLDALDANMQARFEAQTAAIRAQFENTNVPLTTLTTTVGKHGQDIKAMKNDLGIVKEQLAEVKQDNTEFYSKFDHLEKGLEATTQQIAEVRQDINGRFDQVIALLTQRGQ
jgi:chromosome segregation ATPase